MPRRTFLMRRVPQVPLDSRVTDKYLLQWRSVDLYHALHTFPRLDSHSIFGNLNPLELEIGCGTGEYLCYLAAASSGVNFLGLDVSLKALQIAAENAQQGGLENIKFIKTPVQSAASLLVPASLQAVYIHFPEPALHPKFRKRRPLTSLFFTQLHAALIPGGKISFVTDSEELFKEISAIAARTMGLDRTHSDPYLLGFNPPVKSRYQLYWEKHQAPIYRLELVKG